MYSDVFNGDVEALRPIAEAWQKEGLGNKFNLSMDVDEHLKDLNRMVCGTDSDLLVLFDANANPVGYMGLTTFTNPLGKEKIANEHYWYVLPEKRGIGSLRLFNRAIEWAKFTGCSHIIMNASKMASGLHDDICKLYEKLGMKKFETAFIKEI